MSLDWLSKTKKFEYIFQPASYTGKEKFMKVLVYYLKSIFFGIPQGIFMLTKSVPSNLNQTKTKQNRKTILHVRLTDSNTKHWESTQCHFSGQINLILIKYYIYVLI